MKVSGEIPLKEACRLINESLRLSAVRGIQPFHLYFWWKRGYIDKPVGSNGKGEKKWVTAEYVAYLRRIVLLHNVFGVSLDKLNAAEPYFKFKKYAKHEQHQRSIDSSVDSKATSGSGLQRMGTIL